VQIIHHILKLRVASEKFTVLKIIRMVRIAKFVPERGCLKGFIQLSHSESFPIQCWRFCLLARLFFLSSSLSFSLAKAALLALGHCISSGLPVETVSRDVMYKFCIDSSLRCSSLHCQRVPRDQPPQGRRAWGGGKIKKKNRRQRSTTAGGTAPRDALYGPVVAEKVARDNGVAKGGGCF
jgi:hypothetical protein